MLLNESKDVYVGPWVILAVDPNRATVQAIAMLFAVRDSFQISPEIDLFIEVTPHIATSHRPNIYRLASGKLAATAAQTAKKAPTACK